MGPEVTETVTGRRSAHFSALAVVAHPGVVLLPGTIVIVPRLSSVLIPLHARRDGEGDEERAPENHDSGRRREGEPTAQGPPRHRNRGQDRADDREGDVPCDSPGNPAHECDGLPLIS